MEHQKKKVGLILKAWQVYLIFFFFLIILKAWQVYLKKSATQYFILHGWICDRDPYCDLVPIGCGFQVTLEMIKWVTFFGDQIELENFQFDWEGPVWVEVGGC